MVPVFSLTGGASTPPPNPLITRSTFDWDFVVDPSGTPTSITDNVVQVQVDADSADAITIELVQIDETFSGTTKGWAPASPTDAITYAITGLPGTLDEISIWQSTPGMILVTYVDFDTDGEFVITSDNTDDGLAVITLKFTGDNGTAMAYIVVTHGEGLKVSSGCKAYFLERFGDFFILPFEDAFFDKDDGSIDTDAVEDAMEIYFTNMIADLAFDYDCPCGGCALDDVNLVTPKVDDESYTVELLDDDGDPVEIEITVIVLRNTTVRNQLVSIANGFIANSIQVPLGTDFSNATEVEEAVLIAVQDTLPAGIVVHDVDDFDRTGTTDTGTVKLTLRRGNVFYTAEDVPVVATAGGTDEAMLILDKALITPLPFEIPEADVLDGSGNITAALIEAWIKAEMETLMTNGPTKVDTAAVGFAGGFIDMGDTDFTVEGAYLVALINGSATDVILVTYEIEPTPPPEPPSVSIRGIKVFANYTDASDPGDELSEISSYKPRVGDDLTLVIVMDDLAGTEYVIDAGNGTDFDGNGNDVTIVWRSGADTVSPTAGVYNVADTDAGMILRVTVTDDDDTDFVWRSEFKVVRMLNVMVIDQARFSADSTDIQRVDRPYVGQVLRAHVMMEDGNVYDSTVHGGTMEYEWFWIDGDGERDDGIASATDSINHTVIAAGEYFENIAAAGADPVKVGRQIGVTASLYGPDRSGTTQRGAVVVGDTQVWTDDEFVLVNPVVGIAMFPWVILPDAMDITAVKDGIRPAMSEFGWSILDKNATGTDIVIPLFGGGGAASPTALELDPDEVEENGWVGKNLVVKFTYDGVEYFPWGEEGKPILLNAPNMDMLVSTTGMITLAGESTAQRASILSNNAKAGDILSVDFLVNARDKNNPSRVVPTRFTAAELRAEYRDRAVLSFIWYRVNPTTGVRAEVSRAATYEVVAGDVGSIIEVDVVSTGMLAGRGTWSSKTILAAGAGWSAQATGIHVGSNLSYGVGSIVGSVAAGALPAGLTAGEFTIDLTTEIINIPRGFIRSYSTDGGEKWRNATVLPALTRMINRDLNLMVSNKPTARIDGVVRPEAGALIIEFPQINKRPKITRYNISFDKGTPGTWLLVNADKNSDNFGEMVKAGIEIAVTPANRRDQPEWGTFFGTDFATPANSTNNGVDVAPLQANGRPSRSSYMIREAATQTGSGASIVYTPATNPRRITVSGVLRAPNIKTNAIKDGDLRLRGGMTYDFLDGDGNKVGALEGFGTTERNEAVKIPAGAVSVRLNVAATERRPASLAQTLVLPQN
jgi:hypothetical protein